MSSPSILPIPMILLGLFLPLFQELKAAEIKTKPLFNASELQEIDMLLSYSYKKEILHQILKNEAHKRIDLMTQTYLKEASLNEKIKSEEFVKNDPWLKWEKLENYNALERWLNRISPQNIKKEVR
ncbi:MAG: hypothetical protein CME63_05790 [Halobacteriovoraceae bacterium]|nr:hypothetical protein [Halobacteriovoraceae bacterium]